MWNTSWCGFMYWCGIGYLMFSNCDFTESESCKQYPMFANYFCKKRRIVLTLNDAASLSLRVRHYVFNLCFILIFFSVHTSKFVFQIIAHCTIQAIQYPFILLTRWLLIFSQSQVNSFHYFIMSIFVSKMVNQSFYLFKFFFLGHKAWSWS